MQRLIAVLRRPQAIFALVSERKHAFNPPGGEDADPYVERIAPLATIPESICPWRDKDVRAWRALSKVPRLNERAGLAIVRSVIGSVADETGTGALPALRFGNGAVDLRPYLCAPSTEQELLDEISTALEAVTQGVEFPDWHWKQRNDIAALPPAFRRSFLWGLHLSPWKRVQMTLAVFEELQLAEQGALRRAVARLLSLADREIGILWCAVVSETPIAARVRAVELILESRAYRTRPTDQVLTLLANERWHEVWRVLRNGLGDH